MATVLNNQMFGQLLALCDDGDTSFVIDIVNLFKESAANALANIETAIKNNDAEALHDAAHALKGGSLNVGADKVGAIAFALQNLGREGTVEGAESLLADLYAALQAAIAELDSRLSSL